jgi:hypothetical protein
MNPLNTEKFFHMQKQLYHHDLQKAYRQRNKLNVYL